VVFGAGVFTCAIEFQALQDLPGNIKTLVAGVADADPVDAMFSPLLQGGLNTLGNHAVIAGPARSTMLRGVQL
jgi:hypothetical protein